MENSGPVGGIVAVLIHGIGNPKPGSVKRQAEELLANAGVPNDRVHEFNWNQYVAQPVTLGFLSPRSLSELCAALLNAAWLGFERENRLVRTGALLLEFALGLFPLFIAALLLRRYPDAAKPIVPVECCASLRSLRDAFLHDWAPVVGGIACLILAMAAIYRSRHMLVAAARRVLLLAIPDPVALCRVGSLHGDHPLLCHVPGRIVLAIGLLAGASGRPCHAPYRGVSHRRGPGRCRRHRTPGETDGGCSPLSWHALIQERPARPTQDLHHGPSPIEDTRLLLVAHSLGSVIAADCLTDPDSPLDPDADSCLMTLGSPFRRFFARFFCQVYPPPAEIARSIRTRFPRFAYRWTHLGTKRFCGE